MAPKDDDPGGEGPARPRRCGDPPRPIPTKGPPEDPRTNIPPMFAMGAFLVLSILGSLLIAPLLVAQDMQAFENSESALNPLLYVGFILLFTLAILGIRRVGLNRFIRPLILVVVGLTVLVVAAPLLQLVPGIDALNSTALGLAMGGILVLLLYLHPEWWVIDLAGVTLAVGVCAILGISFSIGPIFILLIALAIYDAIAVYRTGHMVDLADSMVTLRLPVLLVIPKKRGYSYLEQKGLHEQLDSGERRGALFMGLGDIIIPGTLAVSALAFLPPETVGIFGAEVPSPLLVALGALAGTAVGFAILMRYVLSGRPQAGLPLLNGGTLAGYVVAYLLVYGDASLGISFTL